MKKIKKFSVISLVFLSLTILFCSCSTTSNNKSDNTNNDTTPKIVSVADKAITGTTIELSVDKTTDTLELFSLVNVTDGAVWKIYDTYNNFIVNKVINLNNGKNTFYIEVALPDGSYSTTYTLKVFKSYDITVTYVWWEGIFTEHILKQVTIEQGELFRADYIPEIPGYDFISWHDYSFDVEFKEGRSSVDFKLVAKVSPKPAKLHLIIDDEEWKTIDTEYGEWVQLPIPEKEHYTFDNWYYESSFGSPIINEYRCYKWGDIYIYGKYVPNSYTITYDYGEMRHNYKDFQLVKYGEDFKIVEPNIHYVTANGIKYVFSGFSYKGEPFGNGKYLYDGNITVTAIWLPEET